MWGKVGKFIVVTVVPAVTELAIKELIKIWKNKYK